MIFLESKPNAVIVEPDNFWRQILFIHLDHSLANFLFVPNALAGLDSARRADPAVVVTELKLPDLPGLEFVRQLRAAPAEKPPSLIIFTNETARSSVEACLNLGVNFYLVKSEVILPSVAALINRHLS